MENLSKAAKLGKWFKRFQINMLAIILIYFVVRFLVTLIFNI